MAQQLDADVVMVLEQLAALGLNPIDAAFGAESAVFSIKKEKVLKGLEAVIVDEDMERAYDKAYTEAKRISAHRETLESETNGEATEWDLPRLLGTLEGKGDKGPTRMEIEQSISQVRDFGFEETQETIEAVLKVHSFNIEEALESFMNFSEGGPGAAAKAMSALDQLEKAHAASRDIRDAAAARNSPEGAAAEVEIPTPAPEAPPREILPSKLADKLVRLCNWEKKKKLTEGATTVNEALYSRLTTDKGTAISIEIQRKALAENRSYPGCGSNPGTLLHQLCDFPADAARRDDIEPLAELLMGLVPIEDSVTDGPAVLVLDALRQGDGHSPLFRAVARGHSSIVAAFLRNQKSHDQATVLVEVDRVCSGRTALLEALAYAGDDPQHDENASNIANMLLNYGADANFCDQIEGKGHTPLFEAVVTSKVKCITPLLLANADPNVTINGVTPFIQAVLKSSEKSVRLLGSKCDVNARGSPEGGARDTTAAIEAVRHYAKPNGPKILLTVLAAAAKGVDVNVVNAVGECCASLAMSQDTMSKLNILEQLLNHPAPANLANVNLGNTLVEIVKFKEKRLGLLGKLTEVGNVNVNEPGNRPLDAVLKSRHGASLAMLDLLLAAGVDVNAGAVLEDDGNTGTAAAARRGSPPLISILKILLAQLEKLTGGSQRQRPNAAAAEEASQEDRDFLMLLEKKLLKIAAVEGLNKRAVDPLPQAGGRTQQPTAVDLLIERHDAHLASLEDQGPTSFWAEVGASGEFGLDVIQEAQKRVREAKAEVQKWGPIVEGAPLKREQFLRRVEQVERSLHDIGDRREVWSKLNDKVLDYERGREKAPALAGREWSDLRDDLALARGDDGGGGPGAGGDGDDEVYQATNLSDLRADGTFVHAVSARRGDGGGGLLEAVAASMGAPPAPSETVEHFLFKHQLSEYLEYMEEEEVDLELLLTFDEADMNDGDFLKNDGDMDRFLLAIQAEEAVIETHKAWLASDAAEAAAELPPTPPAPPPPTLGQEKEEDEDDDGAGSEEDGEYEGDDFVLQAVPSNMEFTRYAYQWIQRSDPKLVSMALKKINLLAEGPATWKRSRQLSKVLEGQHYTPTKIPVREAKLDSGMRILWQERGDRTSIIIWYICKHDFISDKLRDIDNCFKRMNGVRSTFSAVDEAAAAAALKGAMVKGAASVPGAGGGIGAGRHLQVPEVLLDPRGSTPLMVYEVQVHELPQLEEKWHPPMKLTAKENDIVQTEGLVTVVGRSGTGKTVCVAMRMDRDAKRAARGNAMQRSLSQVFVARSRALCAQVRRMVESGGHTGTATGRREVQGMGGGSADVGGGGSGAALSVSSSSVGGAVSEAGPMSSMELAAQDEIAAPKAKFVTIDDFVGLVEDSVIYDERSVYGPKPTWDRTRHVRWHEFEKDFWSKHLSKAAQKGFGVKEDFSAKKVAHKGGKKGGGGGGGSAEGGNVGAAAAEDERPEDASSLVALTVWTQIRSMIKGSAEAAWGYSHEIPPNAPRPEVPGEDPVLDKRWKDYDYKCAEEERPPGTPMCKTQFLRLPRGRCPLGQKQKAAAYEYFEIYQDWLESTGRWDDTDRILKLISRLKSVERNMMTTSIWRNARVPFDRIYADEVQDATQAEITLFSLSCNDNVDGLFLVGDNAQAITHGVSFRFEELRLIMSLATSDLGKRVERATVKPLSLTRNYRSHSGILEFASCFLTQLDVCFEGSFQKLAADSGLAKGPRPGVWSCPRGFASLRSALRLDDRLIILTRDENARALELKLADDPSLAERVNVLGICEAKGLEFNDVLIVDFFTSAPPHLQQAWGDLLKLNVIDPEGPLSGGGGAGSGSGGGAAAAAADSPDGAGGGDRWVKQSSKALKALAQGKVPLELEVDLKNLYTAVTRCRTRLVLCETSATPQWAKLCKQYEKLGLVNSHSLAETAEDGTGQQQQGMMPEELVELGLDFVERVDPEGGDPEQSKRDYHNAIKFFRRAGEHGKLMLERAEAMARHATTYDQVKQLALDPDTSSDWRAREVLAVEAASDLAGVGLVADALKLCRLATSDMSVVGPLLGRLAELDRKWRSDAEQKQQARESAAVGRFEDSS